MKFSTLELLKLLSLQIDKTQKFHFFVLLILMLAGAIAEMISIGAIFPFLLAISEPELVFHNKLLQPFFLYFGFKSPYEILLLTLIIFILCVLLSGIIKLTLLYYINLISYTATANLGYLAVTKTLFQPYIVHISRNSSEVINSTVVKINAILQGVIIPVLNLISSIIMALGILIVISLISYKMSFSILIILGFIYYVFLKFTKQKVLNNSINISRQSTEVVKVLQESLGAIRDIIIDNLQSVYGQIYRKSEISFRLAQASNAFIGSSPRHVIETIGIIVISIVSFFYVTKSSSNEVLHIMPLLGSLALAFQKLLPLLQTIYSAIISIKGSKDSLSDVLDLLNQNIDDNSFQKHNLSFDKAIVINNLSFSYPGRKKEVLRNINLTIPKGSCIGIIGKTGSGKSTLVDIIMGLLIPKKGYIKVDDVIIDKTNTRSWRSNIAHVPQSIFLTDSSIESNIAFGVSKHFINSKSILKAAREAQLSEIINTLPKKYDTTVGERGVSLSGGQMQRIGIARALYKNMPLIVLDEATSALDNITESEVMKNINKKTPKPTIIIIAHRLTTLKNCDFIVELENGKIKWKGSYDEIKQ